ncbi:putative ubiquitin-conjugating enzyme E2 38 isoform X1 [Morus notabilis]|uniref:putative ubiquitin-conjugating enzyme E2 38 isoform X1 n=1 Tax=Morus notabilis TaxID=981085 RepID=UPI000CECF8C6|nr:putative ubiquitin-conjugating enzyme E2 38 isoform X1 [Morus notabilis]
MDKDCDSGEPTLSSASKKLKHTKVASVSSSNSSSLAGSTHGADTLKSTSISNSTESMNMDGSSSDLSYHDDGDHEDGDNSASDSDYYPDYDDEDIYEDYKEFSYIDEYSLLQSNFDNVNVPAGVEASIPLFSGSLGKSIQEAKTLTISDDPETEKKETVTSSSTVHAESSSNVKVEGKNNDYTVEISQFKKFDVVDDFTDHHYAQSGFWDTKPPKDWAKKVQEEWKILENNLPDTIFVRVCEARMELLRAVIVGPAGTPYHDGLFVFDCLFPTNYPKSPPSVYYYSGGLRLNPNLYNCGKVCLSLLGTWSGKKNENWVPGKSTMLQVLVSIQALILNSRPFFNEPGFERYTGVEGERRSNKYNEDVFILSLKTMIYTLRRPPKHFEDLVAQYFRCRANDILVACKAYMEGALVGSNIKDRVNNQVDQNSGSKEFKSAVAGMMNLLLTSFSRNGTPGCEVHRLLAEN